MNARNLITGIKQVLIGIGGEILNLPYRIMDGPQTYADVNRLAHSYTLQGWGKILDNPQKIRDGLRLEIKARKASNETRQYLKEMREESN